MLTAVHKIAPPFALSFGEEDGGFFSALIWPDELGEMPYSGNVTATIVEQGFVIKGGEMDVVVAFLGVSDDVLLALAQSNLTMMQPVDDDYVTVQVKIVPSNSSEEFDFSLATQVQ